MRKMLKNYYESNHIKKEKEVVVTPTDLFILNILLEEYQKTKKPVPIAELESKTYIRYTTIRYSLQKFKNLGIVKELIYNGKKAYEPINKIALVLNKNTVLLVFETFAIPLTSKQFTFENYVGKVFPLEKLPTEIKEILNELYSDISLIWDYMETLRKNYFITLYKQYLKLRQKYFKEAGDQ